MKTFNDIDFTPQLVKLVDEYQRSPRPISVNFRELAPPQSVPDRLTHLFHPYPAKLLPNIPYFFLNSSAVAPPGTEILDPFCGSGTVLVEGIAAGHIVSGADANPLARLITSAKTTPISNERILRAISRLRKSVPSKPQELPSTPLDLAYWYPLRTLTNLSRLLSGIQSIGDEDLKTFFLVCFSALVKRVSYADPRLSVPVKLNRKRASEYGPAYKPVAEHLKFIENIDVFSAYFRLVSANADRLQRIVSLGMPWARKDALHHDARSLGNVGKQYDFILTSPPYVGAQKYIRASSLSLSWLGLLENNELRPLERKNIGREHYSKSEYLDQPLKTIGSASKLLDKIKRKNPLRAHIAANYLAEMDAALNQANSHLRPGGYLTLIAGANLVCGEKFDTPGFLQEIAHQAGLHTDLVLTDTIKSRGLMTKRNKTAGIIDNEVVFLLRKPKWTKAK